MTAWIPLIQTLCWIAVIVWLVRRYNDEIGAILSSIQRRIDRGSSLRAGPFELGELGDSPAKPVAPASSPLAHAPMPGVQQGGDAQHTFLLRSSWNGLKVLKACQWASHGKRLLRLREFVNIGMPMAYDYAFGFLIAAFSADLVIASANPQTGNVVVASVHPTVETRIDEFLEGYIAAHNEHSEELRDDLNALLSYLKAR